jgi:hypothetical protein
MEALDQLLNIINLGVADIKRSYVSANCVFPSLDEPYDGPDELENTIASATTLVVSAALQLVATVMWRSLGQHRSLNHLPLSGSDCLAPTPKL